MATKEMEAGEKRSFLASGGISFLQDRWLHFCRLQYDT